MRPPAVPAARRPGGLICGTCYDRDPARIQSCGQCGQPARMGRPAQDHPWPGRQSRPAAAPADFLDDSEQARQLRSCLNDTGMPLDLRVAGALVLLYGLRLSSIAYITRGDITHHDGRTCLRHHGHQIFLPPRLSTLIGQLARQPGPDTTLARLAGPPGWLFPGNDPTRPASHAHLLTGLRRHGITTHAARNTAVSALAAELPAPVLADITGMHITTAASWTRSSSRDWTQYLAARTQGPREGASVLCDT